MNGALIIDKPPGKTSHDVVREVKKIVGAKKAGHTGTLDPMATGVLTVCLNEATKLAGFLAAEEKEYLATMLMGVKTDTLDSSGKIIAESDKVLPEREIRLALAQMAGKIKQSPPAYSAVKYRGKPLYKWARSGIFPESPLRDAEIFNIAVDNISWPRVTFRVTCSKGTYIRALCSDIGEKLGCGACLSDLRRLRSGFFSEEMAVSLTNGRATNDKRMSKKTEFLEKILPMEKLLPLAKVIEVDDNFVIKLRQGIQPTAEMMKRHVVPFLTPGDMIKFINNEGKLVALAQFTAGPETFAQSDEKTPAAKIVRVFSN
ncbi:MAG TPA: tRNA pseudouridine(55) synthase TruB [Deltaproteobacteria bacterium]|nr:tRNA pseudouridine(55) synthase TruB [Deltaproteobacteria bacterium]